jgi:aryl-alcohol dehydrogenase-like predicted oxidoreductase
VIGIGLGVPLGIWIARDTRIAQPVVGLFAALRLIPILTVLFLALPYFGTGFRPALLTPESTSYAELVTADYAERTTQTDHIDIMQIHGRMYTPTEVEHVLNGGPLDALLKLRDAGTIGHIGITSEEPWTVIPFLAHEAIEVYQIAYNIIYQAAARHFLIEAGKVNAGIVGMRWPHEVEQNIRLLEGWEPPIDFATMPRLTFEVYKAEDAQQHP